jgi:N-acetylneuraminate synthase (EC 2.5.1.56)
MKKVNFKNLKNCFIVAEISANHGQDFNRAVSLIKEAKRCGADAVKFQCYTPHTLTINCNNKYFKVKHHKWGGQTLYQLYQKAYTPWNWFKELKKIAEDLGIIFFATSFDKKSVDFLENLDVPIHKIASFELIDLPLIEYIAKTKKPLILSTGMATLKEIKEAIDTAKKAGAKDIILLKCVSSYPAKPEEMNLITIQDMKKRFKLPVGLSDHTLDITTSIVAISLGAKLIEKHFTLSREINTPDNFFSLEPKEFEELVKNIKIVESLIGKIHYGPTKGEKIELKNRRSLFAIKDIKKGEPFTEENIRSIRPSFGLPPKYLKLILGKKAKKDIKMGTPLTWDLIE